MKHLPVVTVVVPARDEAADIDGALEAILSQHYPANLIEVVVVDGGSRDGTATTAAGRLRSAALRRATILYNPAGSTPAGLNKGLAEAQGEIVCRVDARSRIPRDYVSKCVEVLTQRPDVSVVGGAQVAIGREDDGVVQRGIVRALNNHLGMGLSRYRRGAPSGPAETVYLGAFRTEDLRAAGGWDERFATNQDFELNRRMGRRGLVWFEAGLEVGYLPRRRLRDLFAQYRRFGSWKAQYWQITGDRPRPRQVLLLAAPAAAGLAAAASVVVGPPWWRRSIMPAVVVAAAAVDRVGNRRPAGLGESGVAVAALGVVALGWVSGVWGGLARRRPCPRPGR